MAASAADELEVETPDDYLVSLDARTGKERWHKVIADFNQQYFSTMAPIVVGNHVLVGTGKIGRVFAGIMLGFGCKVIGHDPYPSAEFEALAARYAAPGEIGANADALLEPVSDAVFAAMSFVL